MIQNQSTPNNPRSLDLLDWNLDVFALADDDLTRLTRNVIVFLAQRASLRIDNGERPLPNADVVLTRRPPDAVASFVQMARQSSRDLPFHNFRHGFSVMMVRPPYTAHKIPAA